MVYTNRRKSERRANERRSSSNGITAAERRTLERRAKDRRKEIEQLQKSTSSLEPAEKRATIDRRTIEQRKTQLPINCEDRRIGERRKFKRRTRKSSKSFHNLIRFFKEEDFSPYEKMYEQPLDTELLYKGKKFINLSLVDYYNFGQNEEIKKKACEAINKYGAGALSSKHSYGYLSILHELEENIAPSSIRKCNT